MADRRFYHLSVFSGQINTKWQEIESKHNPIHPSIHRRTVAVIETGNRINFLLIHRHANFVYHKSKQFAFHNNINKYIIVIDFFSK